MSGDHMLKFLLSEGRDLHLHAARETIFVVYERLPDPEFEAKLGVSREQLKNMSDAEFKERF